MASRIWMVVIFLAFVASYLSWLGTKSELGAQNQQYAYSLEEISRLAKIANGELMLTNQKVELANASIEELKQKLEEAERFGNYWWQRAHPRQFKSLDELKAWLAQDDTDSTFYVFGSACLSNYDCDDYAMALVYNALADGYLISTQIVGDHMLNCAVIGNEIYFIEPQTDEVWLWGHRD